MIDLDALLARRLVTGYWAGRGEPDDLQRRRPSVTGRCWAWEVVDDPEVARRFTRIGSPP